jgi:3-isopropylmalate dehydrogenase
VKANIVLLPGDGIGPEVTAAAVQVLSAVASRYQHDFEFSEQAIGGCAIDATGEPLPSLTRHACLRADAVLLGAVGGPKWSDPKARMRPEQGLLQLRALLGVYANLRPVRVHARAAQLSPVKAERLLGVDLLLVRELTGGSYFGARTRDEHSASDECRYTVAEIERVLRRAFELARDRRRRLTSIDKANVLETSRLWRETASRLAAEYPEVRLEHQLVDSMAMLLISRPGDYDVLVTENLFGDILSDEAAVLAGSLGLLPSASLGEGKRGLYEPIHGSAPDIAGQGAANPLGSILSAALLLRHSLGLEHEAQAVEAAVDAVLDHAELTGDLGGTASTWQVTAAVVSALDALPLAAAPAMSPYRAANRGQERNAHAQ